MSSAAKILNAVVFVISLFVTVVRTIGTVRGQKDLPSNKEMLSIVSNDSFRG